MEVFGDTPAGILLLDFILVAIGVILTPLLWGIFSRLGQVSMNLADCLEAITHTNATLAEVVKELHDARVRDAQIEGRLKGIDEKLRRLE